MLEAEGVTIGAVTGVQGISWTELTITGQSNHAGTTPMSMRHDAGYAAAEIAVFARRLAAELGPPQVATVGRIELHPNLVNVVAARDAHRRPAQHRRGARRRGGATAVRLLRRAGGTRGRVDRASLARALRPGRLRRTRHRVGRGDRAGTRALDAADAVGRRPRRADARPRVPGGDGVRPERAGISHNPAELTADADLEAGANVLLHVLLRLATDER